jgi:hypothetical protein
LRQAFFVTTQDVHEIAGGKVKRNRRHGKLRRNVHAKFKKAQL